jgi:hypothetical protein
MTSSGLDVDGVLGHMCVRWTWCNSREDTGSQRVLRVHDDAVLADLRFTANSKTATTRLQHATKCCELATS